MAHSVICTICGNKFDRDKEAYILSGKRRYAHASCALRQGLTEVEIIDPTNYVECKFCKQVFDKSKESFKVFSNGTYAHLSCLELEEKRVLTDEEKLERYIMQLFNTDYVHPRIQKQIKNYVTNYGFSYSGIHKALIYHYEIKQGDISKANGGIGIVEYVYQDAFNYYYALWQAEQIHKDKDINNYIPKIKEIKIPPPECKIKKRKLFSFLDEEETE